MNKILSIAALIAVGFGAALLLGVWKGSPQPEATSSNATSYENAVFGLAYTFPSKYKLDERIDGYQGLDVLVLTMVDASTTVPDMSEGPTAMSVIVVPNASSTPLDEWVKNNTISNFYLAQDRALLPLTFKGSPAVIYQYSGLYENEAMAVSHGGKVYIFSVSWASADEPIRQDFDQVLGTITFTP